MAFDGTYTGTVPNLCIPGADSFDWGSCNDYNFARIVASTTVNGTAVALATTTIAANLATETAARIAADFSIGASTKQTNLDVAAETARALAAEALLAPLTGAGTSGTWGISVTGNAGTATALSADPANAPSGHLAAGIAASGVAQNAWVETAATSGSTNPVTSGAMFTALAGKIATGGLAGTATALAANGTNCAGGQAAIGVDASGNSEGCFAAGTGDVILSADNVMTGSNNFPVWKKYTATNANFSVAALTNTIVLATLPANTVVHGIKIKHSTAFSGTGITAYTVSVGTGAGTGASIYASAYDVFQVVSSSAMQVSSTLHAEGANAYTLTATATSVGANLNAASGAGSVDIWVLKSTTP